MASVLQVATIKDQGGNANAIEIANSSANVTINTLTSSTGFPAGHIIQVVRGETKSRTTYSGTTATETNLQATITPSSTSNKIQVFVTGSWGITGPNLAKFRLYRKVGSASAANAISGTSDDAWQTLQHQIQGYTSISGSDAAYATGFSTALSLQYLDSPSSTEALLYELYFYGDNNTPTIHFNSRPQSNEAGLAQITLMEIVA